MPIRSKLPLLAAAAIVLTVGGVAFAGEKISGNSWPYASRATGKQYTFAAVGDIACEPDEDVNAANPAALKCGSPSLGGYDAEFATAHQALSFKPDAVALLGDEQYQVGKLSDFEGSFEKAWGGLKFLERPAPGNHEYYAYTKKGDNEAAQNGNGYFGYFNGAEQDGTPNSAGQAGEDTEETQGWYSYDLGSWHVISLNVECNSAAFHNDCSTTDGGLLSKETQWLATDLKLNNQPCTVAYWHQPTFSATTASTPTVPASAPGAGGQEGQVADAWWQLLYDNHATLVLNGHEHAYARMRPMDPAGRYDPQHGIPEFIIGTGGESLDTLATTPTGFANPNVVTAYAQGYGVLDLTLKPKGYDFSYRPALAGSGFGASALDYSDSGSGKCQG
ncbi:MAG: metallophosphoesterase family protein [Marmoricola sp.]